MEKDLTVGSERKAMLLFAFPMIAGNVLQQFYNIVDTIVVGKYIGKEALAAVGTSFALMVFLTSAIIGLCMGSGVVLSMFYGAKDEHNFKKSIFISFLVIAFITVIINLLAFVFVDEILALLHVPHAIRGMARQYLWIVFIGIPFTAVYNFFTAILRSAGNSTTAVVCMVIATVVNILLDLYFVLGLHLGVAGVALATVMAQACSALLVAVYVWFKVPMAKIGRAHVGYDKKLVKKIFQYSTLTSIQQSVMNFGILMIQGLVNSFGVAVTAAFAAAVKIDAFAYIPIQDFGNAFSIYIAQNFGAEKKGRIQHGIKEAIKITAVFSITISLGIVVFARDLMHIFVQAKEIEIIEIGIQYLRIEGAFYLGLGILFLLYGLFRGLGRPEISLVLTIASLGTRVILAYLLAPIDNIGLLGIWWAIPIGWFVADMVGLVYYKWIKRHKEAGMGIGRRNEI